MFTAKVNFTLKTVSSKTDIWQAYQFLCPVGLCGSLEMDLDSHNLSEVPSWSKEVGENLTDLPQVSSWSKAIKKWEDEFEAELYQNQKNGDL